MRRFLRTLGGLAGALGLLTAAGCSIQVDPRIENPSEEIARPLTVGTFGRVTTTDPAAATDTGSTVYALNVFQRLMTVEVGSDALKPDAATDCWYIDPLTYSCGIRKNLSFTNGNPLTASDVKFSIERAKRLNVPGSSARLLSFERRADFAEIAQRNVRTWLGGDHPGWDLRVGDLVDSLTASTDPAELDRVVLDMLAPWECVPAVAERLVPGGVLLCYVATTTQLGRVMDTIRAHQGFTEPSGTETIVRNWHAEGLAIRPAHGSTSHTGFLVTARRLAPGVSTPLRKRRPAPGAYGPDYTGPRPPWAPTESAPEES